MTWNDMERPTDFDHCYEPPVYFQCVGDEPPQQQDGAPQLCLLVYKPHEYYSYKYHKP